MNEMKKLPDSEFAVMQAVWAQTPPVTAGQVQNLVSEYGWKLPTVISFLKRLVEKGYLSTQKEGKERRFSPLIEQQNYLQFETQSFLKQYHGSSVASLVNTLYNGKNISDSELNDLLQWVHRKKEENDA